MPARGLRGMHVAAALVAAALLGCQTTSPWATALVRGAAAPRIVLMPIDVELFELQASGMLEPKAEWTQRAHAHLTAALEAHMRGFGAEAVAYVPPDDAAERETMHVQLVKLHAVVADTIATYSLQPVVAPLPTKPPGARWSLGPQVGALREDTGGDYAVFVVLRDSYATAGRAAVMLATAILSQGGYMASGGVQIGYASLVDLRTGEVVWFHSLQRGFGDVRESAGARETVKALLEDFPQ